MDKGGAKAEGGTPAPRGVTGERGPRFESHHRQLCLS